MTLTRSKIKRGTQKCEMPALAALALAALFLCPAFTARARQPAPAPPGNLQEPGAGSNFTARAEQPAPAPPATEGKTRLLTVDDVVQMVLTNNLDIQITKYTPIVDQFALNSLYSAYDPSFSFSVTRSMNTSPAQYYLGFLFPPNTTANDNYSASLGAATPFGLSYSLSAPLSQQTSPVTQYNTSPSLSLTQPILKNFWIDNTRYQIQLSRKTLRSDQLALRLQMENSVNSIKTAYFNLIAARENVQVQRAAVRLAQQLMDENTKKVQLGSLAPLDQRQAESQAASSQSDLLAAELAQAVQENTLKSLLALHLDEWRDVTPVPAETLLAVPENPDLAESLRRAMSSRPELLQAKISLEKQHVTLSYTRNQLYPELDLKASYGFNSGGATFGQTWDTLRQGTDPAYSFGATLTYPLDNIAARNTYKSAKASLEQLLLQLKKVETTIVVAVDNDVKTIRSDLLRVDATRKAREYAEDALRAGQARLEAGSTTSFEVLQLQNNLTSARSAEIRALADYNIALEQLALDEGTTLERNKLDLKMP